MSAIGVRPWPARTCTGTGTATGTGTVTSKEFDSYYSRHIGLDARSRFGS